jgi:hypothetical protein
MGVGRTGVEVGTGGGEQELRRMAKRKMRNFRL